MQALNRNIIKYDIFHQGSRIQSSNMQASGAEETRGGTEGVSC